MVLIVWRAFELFTACMVAHLAVWRMRPGRSQGVLLLPIFFGSPLLVFVAALFGISATPESVPIAALIYVLHAAVSGMYIFVYSAVSGVSPSISILERVDRSMPLGLSRAELAPEWFTDSNLSGARLQNLLASGLVRSDQTLLRLRPRGQMIAKCFLLFRRTLGLPDVAKG